MSVFIVSVRNEQGQFDDVGMNNRFLTSHYKTLNGLLKYGISAQWKKRGIRIQNSNNVVIYTN